VENNFFYRFYSCVSTKVMDMFIEIIPNIFWFIIAFWENIIFWSLILFWGLVIFLIYYYEQFKIIIHKSKIPSINIKLFEKRNLLKNSIVLFFIVVFIFYFLVNYFSYNAMNLCDRDFPTYIQIIWKLSEGIKPITTIFHRHFLADHWTPIFIPIAVLYKIIPHPLTISTLNILVFLAGAWFIYLIAEMKIKHSFLSFVILLSLFVNPYVYWALIMHANPDIYSFFFISFAFYCLLKNKHSVFLISSFLAMNCKEDVSLYFIVIGIWCFLYLKKYKLGIFLSLFSFLYFLFVVYVGMPFFSQEAYLANFGVMYSIGNSFEEIVFNIIREPSLIMKQIFSYRILFSVSFLLAPLLLFFIFGGNALILVIIPMLIKLLSSAKQMYFFSEHHIWHPLFFVYFASIIGITRVRSWLVLKRGETLIRASYFLAIIIFISLSINLLFWRTYVISRFEYHTLSQSVSTDRTHIWRRAFAQIPSGAALLADANFLTYSPNRTVLYEINMYHEKMLNEVLKDVEYCFFDFKTQYPHNYLKKLKPITWRYLENSQEWKRVFSEDGVIVFKRF
jgi:uncharacterized membrane protein